MVSFFIKKIVIKDVDDSVHSKFTRYSRGVFERKALLTVKRNGKIKMNGSYEIANDMVLFIASLVKKMKVFGAIFSKKEIPGLSGRKKGELLEYAVDQDMDYQKIKEISKLAYLMFLDCEADSISFKIKKKTLPKPSPKGDKLNDKFWTCIMDIKYWNNVKAEFLFDFPEAKKYEVKHNYDIQEVLMPKGEKDYEKIRALAKKKGKIIRKAIVDGTEITNELDFEA